MILVWREGNDSSEATLTNISALDAAGFGASLCIPLPRPLPESVLEIESRGQPSDFIKPGPYWIASEALRSVIESFGVNVEFAELKVQFKKKSYTKSRYYLMNIMEQVDCLDFARSEYTMEMANGANSVHRISKIVFDESKAAGHHLFLLGPRPLVFKPMPNAIFDIIPGVSKEFAIKILDAGLTGVEFVKPEDVRTYPGSPWR